jgi:hypothetical protein
MTPDFHILNYTDNGYERVGYVGCGRDAIDFAVRYRVAKEPSEVLADIVGALLERAAVSPEDMLQLCGLKTFDVEKAR